MRLLELLSCSSRFLLPAGLATGLAAPELAALLRPALPMAVFLLLVLAMIRIPWSHILSLLRRPGFPALCTGWALLAVPLLVALAWWSTGWDATLGYALVIASAGPALMAGPAFALLVGLNAALALVVTVSTLIVVPFSLPFVTWLATQEAIVPSAPAFLLRSLVIVFGALAIASALRRAVGPAWLDRQAGRIDAVSIVVLFLFAIGVMEGMAQQFSADPAKVARYVVAAFLVNLLVQLASAVVFRARGYHDALTVSLVTGGKNAAILLAIVPPPIDPAIVLYVGAAQFPLYILPFMLEPVYRRLSRRAG